MMGVTSSILEWWTEIQTDFILLNEASLMQQMYQRRGLQHEV